MIWTLQNNITRELLKTFALTAIGLTLTFSLCGGVLNMIEAEVLTALEMVRILGFVLPIALTLMLPVSALFACAIVYGRLAADNEFDACKASGINVHRLLAPAFGLSVATAAFTFSFVNFVLPLFVEQLEAMVRKDLHKMVTAALKAQGYFKYQGLVLSAGKTEERDLPGGGKQLIIRNARFLELEGRDLTRAGTADRVQISFWSNPESDDPIASAVMYDIRAMDLLYNRLYEEVRQPFDPVPIPSQLEQKPKWLRLPDLFRYRDHPEELTTIKNRVLRIRRLIREAMFYRYVIEQLTEGEKVLRLERDQTSYEIRAERVSPDRPDPTAREFKPKLLGVSIKRTSPEGERQYRANRCDLSVKAAYRAGRPDRVYLMLQDKATFTDAVDPSNVVSKKRIDFEARLPAVIGERESALSDVELIGSDLPPEQDPASLELGTDIDGVRTGTHREIAKTSLQITGLIHSRLAFSASVLVTLVLAAALGMIFRGGQFLTAFVISFIPGLLVVVLNIMGRQLAKDTGTAMIGVVVIWSAIGLLGVVDAVVLKWFLRR